MSTTPLKSLSILSSGNAMWSKSVDTFGMGSTTHYLYDLRPSFKYSLFLHLLNEEDNNNSINNDIYLITSS